MASLPDPDSGQPKNFLRACLLLFLAEAPAHGYDLLERVRDFGLEREPGSLYRALRAMEHEGLVRSEWEASMLGPDRRRYQLTQSGLARLRGWVRHLDETRSLLDRFLDRHAARGRAGG